MTIIAARYERFVLGNWKPKRCQLFSSLCIYILLLCCGFFSFQFRTHKFQFAMQVSKLILLSICLRQRKQCWSCCCWCCSCRCVQSVLNFVVNDVVDVYVDALGAQFRKAHYAIAMDEAHTHTHSIRTRTHRRPLHSHSHSVSFVASFQCLETICEPGQSFVRSYIGRLTQL